MLTLTARHRWQGAKPSFADRALLIVIGIADIAAPLSNGNYRRTSIRGMVTATAKLRSPLFGGTNMMMEHRWTAVVTLLALLVYFWMSLQVGRARSKSGINPPAMTGDPLLERAVRVQSNTLEWLPIFIVSLWLFAIYWNELVAAGLGVIWIVGRLVYSAGYMADPAKRSTGFLIQLLACAVLLFGALGKIVYSLAIGGM
jgi:glutathione S-transferase